MAYLWVFGLALFGGLVSFIQKAKRGAVRAWNVTELIGELLISAFAGLLTFYLCEAAELSQPLSAAFIAISGHMGPRAIFLLENAATKHFKNLSKAEKE